jgi:uncharacterized membrane protein YdbT with pleckstrin-like domain
MGIPERLLSQGERVEISTRPHWKDVVGPAIVLLVVAPLASYLAGMVPEGSAQGWLRLAIALIALAIIAIWSVWPFMKWISTSYVVTNQRIITRSGVFARQGRDMPLSRVNDVSFSHSNIFERVLRCGTLTVESAGESGQLIMRDVPHVEEIQRDLYRLAEDNHQQRQRGGYSSDARDSADPPPSSEPPSRPGVGDAPA